MTVITPFSIINGILGLVVVNEKQWESHLDLRIEEHAYPVSSGVLLRISMSPHNGMRNGGIMEYWDLKTELFRQTQYSNIPVFHYSDWGRALKLSWPQYLSEPDRHIL